jgi:hypothetical protein
VAVTALLALVPLVVLVVGLVLPSRQAQLAAALGLGIALLKNVGYDLFQLDSPQRSWTMILVGAALLAAGFLFQLLVPGTARLSTLGPVVVSATIVYAISAPIDLFDDDWHGISQTGLALVVPAAVYATLCALAVPVERLRDSSPYSGRKRYSSPSSPRRSSSTVRRPPSRWSPSASSSSH